MTKEKIVARFLKLSKEMKECSELMEKQAVTSEWRKGSVNIRNASYDIDEILYRWTYEPEKQSIVSKLLNIFKERYANNL